MDIVLANIYAKYAGLQFFTFVPYTHIKIQSTAQAHLKHVSNTKHLQDALYTFVQKEEINKSAENKIVVYTNLNLFQCENYV